MSKNKLTWKNVKTVLAGKSNAEILKLVSDLYALNEANKSFIHSRYSIGTNLLEPYKEIISGALYPDIIQNQPIRFSVGKKAISDYFKATKNEIGQIELMIYYVEMGNQFTINYGDIDEQFYSSLESMFNRILSNIEKQPTNIQKQYLPRLENIVDSVRSMGWGYYDYLSETFEEFKVKASAE